MRGEGRGYGIEEKVREVGSTAWKAPFKAPLRDWQGDPADVIIPGRLA